MVDTGKYMLFSYYMCFDISDFLFDSRLTILGSFEYMHAPPPPL